MALGQPYIRMNFNDIDDIKKNGFVGFRRIEELFHDRFCLPPMMGVYMVLYTNKNAPLFLPIGTGGHFKGKDPNVPVEELRRNWIAKCVVVYIGKAGGLSISATLRSRLRQYLSFGLGKNIGHWGGRYIWQLGASGDFVVCWKPLIDDDPKAVESVLIREFVTRYGSRPFANLVD